MQAYGGQIKFSFILCTWTWTGIRRMTFGKYACCAGIPDYHMHSCDHTFFIKTEAL